MTRPDSVEERTQKAEQNLAWDDRFWAKVREDASTGCWLWTASKTSEAARGYGVFIGSPYGTRLAHRIAYQYVVGLIAPGLEIDHRCRDRRCVNPAHLEPVTHRENVLRGESPSARAARKTHCTRGHPLEGDNLEPYALRRGERACKKCRRLRHRRRDQRIVYTWFWNRMGRKGQRCRVVCRGAMNSALIEFEDGYRAVTSRNGLRRAPNQTDAPEGGRDGG